MEEVKGKSGVGKKDVDAGNWAGAKSKIFRPRSCDPDEGRETEKQERGGIGG